MVTIHYYFCLSLLAKNVTRYPDLELMEQDNNDDDNIYLFERLPANNVFSNVVSLVLKSYKKKKQEYVGCCFLQ